MSTRYLHGARNGPHESTESTRLLWPNVDETGDVYEARGSENSYASFVIYVLCGIHFVRGSICPLYAAALFIYPRGRVAPSALFIPAAICIRRDVELERTTSPIFPALNQILLAAGAWGVEKRRTRRFTVTVVKLRYVYWDCDVMHMPPSILLHTENLHQQQPLFRAFSNSFSKELPPTLLMGPWISSRCFLQYENFI